MKIEDIRRPKGSAKRVRRVGRGNGSGRGKTCGRGSKGAKSRSGPGLRIGFEGGQMPLIRRLPKRGFINVGKKIYQIINVQSLNHFKKGASVDKAELKKAGLIKKIDVPVKILGDGDLAKPIDVTVEALSKSAKKKIEDSGGKYKILKKA